MHKLPEMPLSSSACEVLEPGGRRGSQRVGEETSTGSSAVPLQQRCYAKTGPVSRSDGLNDAAEGIMWSYQESWGEVQKQSERVRKLAYGGESTRIAASAVCQRWPILSERRSRPLESIRTHQLVGYRRKDRR